MRVEHWTSAAGQAHAVAAAITGAERPYEDEPYFWSDQFGLRLQHVGHAETWDTVVLDGRRERVHRALHRREGRVLRARRKPQRRLELRRELAA